MSRRKKGPSTEHIDDLAPLFPDKSGTKEQVRGTPKRDRWRRLPCVSLMLMMYEEEMKREVIEVEGVH